MWPVKAMVFYFAMGVMASMPIGVAAMLTQTPTMSVHNPKPSPRVSAPRPSYAGRGSDQELRDAYNSTIPVMENDIERLQQERAADRLLVDQLRLNDEATRNDVATLKSYATYQMAILSAVVIGMLLQIWQLLSSKRQQAT